MKEFIFRKNLWILDFIVSMTFAVGYGYCFYLISDNAEWSKKIDLLFGALAYAVTFVSAFVLRKRYAGIPSWAWLGVFAALLRVLILESIWLPVHLNYPRGHFVMVYDLFVGTAVNWIFWAIPCLLCIFSVRTVAYLFRNTSLP
jgi:hypothetical protein